MYLWRFFTEKFANSLQLLKSGKSSSPDALCPERIVFAGSALKSWLNKLLSSCMRQLKLPKICRKVLVIAIPEPNKLLQNQKSYRPIHFSLYPLQDLGETYLCPCRTNYKSTVFYKANWVPVRKVNRRPSQSFNSKKLRIACWPKRRPALCLSISLQPTILYGTAAYLQATPSSFGHTHGLIDYGTCW